MGRGGIQYTANQGQEWTSIRTTTQEGDFQVSKRVKFIYRQKGTGKGVSNKKNHKGCYKHVHSICISVLIKVVFRL
jgi:hypothetical protein